MHTSESGDGALHGYSIISRAIQSVWRIPEGNHHHFHCGHPEKLKLFERTGSKEFPDADLKLLTQRCHENFSNYAMLTPYPSQQDDRIDFCVTYNIPIAGVIPTLEEADAILKASNLQEQLRVMKLMETPPKKIEPTLTALLNKRSLQDRSTMNEIQTLAIDVLVKCKTTDIKAMEYMISVLPHYGNDTEADMEALSEMGKPAEKPLMARLDKTSHQDGKFQFQLITLLGQLGEDLAEKSIQRILSITRNSDVRYAAETAIQSIKGYEYCRCFRAP